MMDLWGRSISSILTKTVKRSTFSRVHTHRLLLSKLFRIPTEPETPAIISSICDSLRKGHNWDTLSKTFASIQLSDKFVENVLVELKDPADAKRALGFFHWSAQRKKFPHGVESYCLMVHILVRARLVRDAQALLESLLRKSVGCSSRFEVVDSLLGSYEIAKSSPFVFDLLVRVYAKLRLFEIGFDVCCHLEENGFSLSVVSFNTLIHVVQKSDKVEFVWTIYEHMIWRRVYPNEATIKMMTSALCKEGKLKWFVGVLDEILHGKRCSPRVIVNGYLVLRILDEGRIEEGLALLKRMLQKNLVLDNVAYSFIVYSKTKLGNLESAKEVYEEMLKRGFEVNSFVYGAFIGAYCEKGRIEEAAILLQEMENAGLKPSGWTFDFLICGCARRLRVEDSMKYIQKMMEMGFVPSLSAFNEMVDNLHEIQDVKRANALLTLALDKGFKANITTYSLLIAGFCKCEHIEDALKLYYEVEYRSLSPGLSVFASLIKCFCHCGKLDEAGKFYKIMRSRSIEPNEEIYEALIVGHEKMGDKATSLHLYDEMVSGGMELQYVHSFAATMESNEA